MVISQLEQWKKLRAYRINLWQLMEIENKLVQMTGKW